GDLMIALRQAGLIKHVTVDLDLPGAPITIPLSHRELEHVVINLVKNAVEALMESHPAQPYVRIRVAPAPSSPSMVVCTVSDNAGGISAATLPLLFEPYFTTKPVDCGTGLGLFAVQQIV